MAVAIRWSGRSKAMGFAAFAGQKYLNLETFKKSGDGVKTPVWFAAEPSAKLDSSGAKLYVYTIGVSGKVKRIRNNSRVRIAPCDMRGGLKGEWVDARAEIVTGAEAERGMGLFLRFGRRDTLPGRRKLCRVEGCGNPLDTKHLG